LTCRGIDYALANGEIPQKANELPILMKQVISTAKCGFIFMVLWLFADFFGVCV
jgi:hypothetical protein